MEYDYSQYLEIRSVNVEYTIIVLSVLFSGLLFCVFGALFTKEASS